MMYYLPRKEMTPLIMKFFYQENLFNYLMLAAFVQADISTEKSSYLTEF